MAQWSEIAGYEGLYLVSDEGEVVALPKVVKTHYRTAHRKAKPIKIHLRGKNGLMYAFASLSKDGKTKAYSVHRLVAQAFIPNPDNLPEVNHKDENPLNNRVENLEWCTRQYNIDYSKSKPVCQYDESGISAEYKSIAEASRVTGIGRTSINNVLCGWSKTAGGYKWAYAND